MWGRLTKRQSEYAKHVTPIVMAGAIIRAVQSVTTFICCLIAGVPFKAY